jgi:hypothetical protein
MNLNKLLYIAGVIVVIIVIIFFIWWNNEDIVVNNEKHFNNTSTELVNKSVLTGEGCNNFSRRPVAVMLAGDVIARPLSGIGEADMVFEMPITPDGITRFMAVYQCGEPREIGSVRSARQDFIPLAGGLKAIYAHWGGELAALEELNGGALNNVDALKYEGTAFFRKPRIAAPHNGFTNLDLILNTAKDLKYSQDNQFEGYPHSDQEAQQDSTKIINSVEIPYVKPFDVKWLYDSATNQYKRVRGGNPEIDKNTNTQVSARVIVVMTTKGRLLRDQYIRVNVTGQGDAKIYQNGNMITGIWKKGQSNESKLYFYDLQGKEIEFSPGRIWVEIQANL